jgi:hypothetical protein
VTSACVPFLTAWSNFIAHNHSFFNHHHIHTRHHYIPKHDDRQHDTLAISDTKHKMGSEETYGGCLYTLLEEARAANKIGDNRKPLSEFLIDFQRKQKAFEEAQRQKFDVSGASSDSSTLTLILQLIDLADSSMRESPRKTCGDNIVDSPSTIREKEGQHAQSRLPSMSSSSSSHRLNPSVSVYQPQKLPVNPPSNQWIPPQHFNTQAERDAYLRGVAHGYARGTYEGYARGAYENYIRGSHEGFAHGCREGYARGTLKGSQKRFVTGRAQGLFEATNKITKVVPYEKVLELPQKPSGVGWF